MDAANVKVMVILQPYKVLEALPEAHAAAWSGGVLHYIKRLCIQRVGHSKCGLRHIVFRVGLLHFPVRRLLDRFLLIRIVNIAVN